MGTSPTPAATVDSVRNYLENSAAKEITQPHGIEYTLREDGEIPFEVEHEGYRITAVTINNNGTIDVRLWDEGDVRCKIGLESTEAGWRVNKVLSHAATPGSPEEGAHVCGQEAIPSKMTTPTAPDTVWELDFVCENVDTGYPVFTADVVAQEALKALLGEADNQ